MNKFEILWQLILADFKERTRRYSYLITLMVSLFIGYLVLTGKYSYTFGIFKPEYNSHWIGTTVALAGAAMFTIMGFYIVRSSISRDRETRVGEILATTSLSNISYLFSKFTSNLLVLWSMVTALVVTAFVGMIANVPFEHVNFVAFIKPFILFPMVITILVASVAVLFDTARWLRGVVGNILYFFFAEMLIVTGIFNIPYFDASGMGLFMESVKGTIEGIYPGEKISVAIGFVEVFEDILSESAVKTFIWNGLDWSLPLVLSRFIWPAAAMIVLIAAVLLFDRFEQSKKSMIKKKAKHIIKNKSYEAISQHAFTRTISYKSLPTFKISNSVIPLIFAELKLSLKELKPVWYMIGLALIASELFAPFDIVRKYLLPAAMIWPLVLWSSIGSRESRFNMQQLMFSSNGVHKRQYIAMLLSGIVIGLSLCLPMVVRSAIAGEFSYLMIIISSAFLLPTAAFALGVVSGSRKMFEVIFPMIWYAGSIDQIKEIDLLGTTNESTNLIRVSVFITIAIGSALIAFYARRNKGVS